ncbi:MAG: sensor histidine kinase [Bacteroidota bacterium]
MTNKTFYLLISLTIVGTLIYFLVLIHEKGNLFFLVAEGLVILIIILLALLYQRVVRPIKVLHSVSLLLKEKDFNTHLGTTGHPEIDAIVSTYNQMVSHLREERLKQEEQHYFLNQLIEASPGGILILGFDGSILKVNLAAQKLLDLPETTPLPLAQLEHPLAKSLTQLAPLEHKVVQTGGIARYKIQHGLFMDKGLERSFFLVEELTRELLEAEKNSYETIIRTMSHEVNNTVGAVNSIMETVSHQFSAESSFHKALTTAIERSEHMNEFMANYARLVKLPAPHIKEFSLNKMLQQLCTLYRHNGNNTIDFQLHIPPDQWNIKADETQMEQVFSNIMQNSIEAIGERGEIVISIDAENKELHFQDTGKGISKEIENKLFTPFVSDKKQGQGIGLMVVKEILLNHKFSFKLTTQNKRTTFSIRLGSALVHVP